MKCEEAREIVGQSFLLRFPGPDLTDEVREAFAAIRPGGVIFFGDNLTSREQTRRLTNDLQTEARSLGMQPLLIGIDQEGGVVSRFSADMVTVPGAMAMTALGDREVTQRVAGITGLQLREMGINADFAPVADVNNNPANPVIRTRSYGDTVEKVETGVLATMAGLEATGVMPTLKHFPGHGDTSVDSHLGLPVIPHSLERLHDVELRPFRTAIEAGVPAIMTTHIVFPVLDDYPATLSRAILTGLLREELGFEGLIVTDSLSMDAIEDRYGLAETAIRCKLAGVDLLEANESLANQRVRHEALVDALLSGEVPETIFRATNERLDAMRERYGMGEEPPALRPDNDDLRAEVEWIAARTIADLGPEPLQAIGANDSALIVDFQRLRQTEAEDPFNRAGVLRQAIAEVLPTSLVVTLGPDPALAERERVTNLARKATTLVILTRDAVQNPDQVAVARACLAAAQPGARTIHVALRGPYDSGALGTVTTTLCTFGDPTSTLLALVRVLSGQASASGHLPVSLIS